MARDAGRLLVASLSVLLALPLVCFLVGCLPQEGIVSPLAGKYFEDLEYGAAAVRYKETAENRYEARDNSYPLSLLTYAVVSLYDGDIESAKRGFGAAYKIDEGNMPEAAKFYQWLQVESRTVYRMSKRERELAHLYLGLAYLLEDNLGESLVEFKKLRLVDQEASKLPLVNFYMGLVYEKMGSYDDALIEYRGLADMGMRGRHSRLDADGLVSRVEVLRAGTAEPVRDSIELVVHVDHQFVPSVGRTEVHADGKQVGVLPPYVDDFDVRLTPAELARKEAQEATARLTREGIRLVAGLLARKLFRQSGDELADLAADIAFGDEDENRDTRFWSYAPVAVSVARIGIPAGTSEVKLVFYGQGGGRLGSCRYPLAGPADRAFRAADAVFVVAGLAKEFYVY